MKISTVQDLTGVLQELDKITQNTTTKGFSICDKGGRKLRSPSRIMKNIENPFYDEYWSAYSAMKKAGYPVYPIFEEVDGEKIPSQVGVRKFGEFYPEEIDQKFDLKVSAKDLKNFWTIKSKYGREKGNFVDTYIETGVVTSPFDMSLLKPHLNDVHVTEDGEVIRHVEVYQREVLDVIRQQIDDFFAENPHLEILHNEFVVGSADLGLGGRVDAIVWDHLAKGLFVYDWKTDNDIDFENKYAKYRHPMSHLDDCKFNKYSFQTSLYTAVIEYETDLKVAGRRIGWFNYKNPSYTILELPYLEQEVRDVSQIL